MELDRGSDLTGGFNTEINVPIDRRKYMLNELERLKREWDEKTEIKIPEVKKFERKELVSVDRAGVGDKVEKELAPELIAGTNTLKSKADKKTAEAESLIKNEELRAKNKEQDIFLDYQDNKENSKNDMIKQGIARSSIAEGERERIENEASQSLGLLREESQNKIKGYELEIALLEKTLKSDLESLRLSHAVKVQQRIDKIVSDIDKENEKILEYNNKVADLEARAEEERAEIQHQAWKESKALARQEAKYGYSGEKKDNYMERYDVAKAYYNTLPKEQALNELQSEPKMRTYLGLYFDMLQSYLLSKEG